MLKNFSDFRLIRFELKLVCICKYFPAIIEEFEWKTFSQFSFNFQSSSCCVLCVTTLDPGLVNGIKSNSIGFSLLT